MVGSEQNQRPEETCLLGDEGWRAIGASAQGVSHAARDVPCQDAHAYAEISGGYLVIAVADGAGSAELSEVGARIAVDRACEAMIRYVRTSCTLPSPPDWRTMLEDTLASALTAVESAAARFGREPKDLASTLIVVVVGPSNIAAAQVGDGAVVLADETGQVQALTKPDTGEYLNETTFLVSPGALSSAQITVWERRVSHVAVFTDGLEMLALRLPDWEPHPPFFAPLFRFVAETEPVEVAADQLREFLRSSKVIAQTDDDLTLVLAARVGAPVE